MTPRLANDVIIIWVYYQGAVDTLYTVGFRDVSGLRIKQLQEFLKSDHWLRRYCILSGGVFYFEPRCITDMSTAYVEHSSVHIIQGAA